MAYGVCKVCGCTDNDPCHNPEYGNCWWVDDTHELCSHCANTENGFDPYPGIERKDLAALGCPFPDDAGDMCADCSHNNISSIFTKECDLGIRIEP